MLLLRFSVKGSTILPCSIFLLSIVAPEIPYIDTKQKREKHVSLTQIVFVAITQTLHVVFVMEKCIIFTQNCERSKRFLSRVYPYRFRQMVSSSVPNSVAK